MLINRTSIVSAAHYQYQRVYFNISGKERYVVSGNVTETSGYDINFFVFDQNGYNIWREGGSSLAYVNAEKIESCGYTFVINQSGYYYFILDNTYTFFINKVPEITASYGYQVNTTKYRDVQKTRTVTRARPNAIMNCARDD